MASVSSVQSFTDSLFNGNLRWPLWRLLIQLLGEKLTFADTNDMKLLNWDWIRSVLKVVFQSSIQTCLRSFPVVPGMSTGELSSLESLSSSNLNSQLSRRDMNNILTKVCCQVGCRKSDLTFLCWDSSVSLWGTKVTLLPFCLRK